MQLTKLDRWLKERFIYETHIFTLRLPDEGLPKGVTVRPMEENKGGDYNHRLIIQDNELAEYVVEMLKQNQVMHATHVMESKNWYNRYSAPKDHGSFTFKLIFRFFSLVLVCIGGWGIYQLSLNEELMKMIKASINDIKSGL